MSAAAAKRTVLAALSIVAVIAASILMPAGGASSERRDHAAPTAPANVRVTTATPSLVRIAWDASVDDVGVEGYYVFGFKGKVLRDKGKAVVETPEYTVTELQCGQSTDVTIVAFDASQNRSDKATATVATAACADVTPPTAPSDFRQVATSESAVVLGWSPSADDVGVVAYGVYRNLLPVATPTDPVVTLAGLSCGTTYEYTVDAADAAGNRSALANAYVRTASCPSPSPSRDTTPPSSPTALAASDKTQTGMTLNWNPSTDNVGVTGYDVYRNGTKVATVTSTSSNQTSLTCGTSYAFGVVARDAAGNASPQAPLTTSTTACSASSSDTTPPSSPTALAASDKTQTGMTLNWNPSTDNVGVTGYDVYRNGTKVATVTSTSSNQTSLTCGTSYAFGVVARDAAGNASPQAPLTTSTTACSASSSDTTPPSAPTGLRITGATATTVSLSWGPSTDNVGVVGYRTYTNGLGGATTSQPNASVSGLTCGTAYTFEVDAFDAAGNRSSKAPVIGSTAACADTQPPSIPANLVATSRTATSIALSWSESTDNVAVVGYSMYRGGVQVGVIAGTTGIFSGLVCNTSYTLGVDAYDVGGNHSAQAVVMVSTTACPDTTPPSAPTNLSASSVTQTGMTLSWNPSTDNVGVTGYDVYRNSTKMATVTSASSNQTGLACGTSYSFGVEAFDAAGNRSNRAQANGTTSACSPPPSVEPGPIADQGYTKRFEDNFNSLDTSFWRPSIWYEPEAPASDVYVDNGVLNLVSRQSAGYPDRHAMTRTQTWQGGYFEARMRYTASPSAFPAMFMMSDNWMRTGDCSALKISEFDIFEGFPVNATRSHSGALHRNTTGACGMGDEWNSNSWTNDVGTDLGGTWHVYSGLWTPSEVRWYVDGVELKRFPVWDTTNQPMRLIFQIANHGGTTPSEHRTEVDWIRVWQK